MTSRVWQTYGAWIGLSFALLGCDSGEPESVRVTECRKVCAKRDACIRATDIADCEKRCDDQEHRSDLYYKAKATCVLDGTLSCDEWAHELDDKGQDLCVGELCVLDSCVQRAVSREKLSSSQEEYCEDLSNRLVARCDPASRLSDLVKRCRETVRQVSDGYAVDTKDCVYGACADVDACLEDLAARYGTDIRMFSLSE